MFNIRGDLRVSDILLFLFFMILVGFMVKIGSGVLFNKGIETNTIEAQIILEKVESVLLSNENIEQLYSDSFSIYSEGDFDQEIIENGQYFFGIEVVNSDDFIPLTYGTKDFKVECGLLKSIDKYSFSDGTICETGGENLPSCCIKEVLINSQTVRLLSAVRK